MTAPAFLQPLPAPRLRPDDSASESIALRLQRAVAMQQQAISALCAAPMRWHEAMGHIEDARDLVNGIDTGTPVRHA